MSKTLKDINQNEFCIIKIDGVKANVRVVQHKARKNMFEKDNQVKIKAVGKRTFDWLCPDTVVL